MISYELRRVVNNYLQSTAMCIFIKQKTPTELTLNLM